jgi:hypothetical protein
VTGIFKMTKIAYRNIQVEGFDVRGKGVVREPLDCDVTVVLSPAERMLVTC